MFFLIFLRSDGFGAFFSPFLCVFYKKRPKLYRQLIADAFVNVLAVKNTDVLVNELFEGKRRDIEIGNLTESVYLVTVSIASVK